MERFMVFGGARPWVLLRRADVVEVPDANRVACAEAELERASVIVHIWRSVRRRGSDAADGGYVCRGAFGCAAVTGRARGGRSWRSGVSWRELKAYALLPEMGS